MLNADSSALNRESDDQSSPTAPMMPSAAALSCTRCTRVRMLASELLGNARLSSFTRKSEASARCAKPRSERERKASGKDGRSAKYATHGAEGAPPLAK